MHSHSIKGWFLATRPWSFPASAMPVLVTMAWMYSDGLTGRWWLGFLAVLNIVIVHAAGNTWSDYHDFKKGVDRDDTYGTKNLTSGLFTAQQMLKLSVSLQVIAVVMGCVIVALTGWQLLAIGIGGILLSLLYPPLKYHALGDVVIMFCYALLPMVGTTFIVGGELIWKVLWLSVPVGLITIAILHSNNTRDIETDQRAGIKTFSMLTGRAFAAWVYVFEVLFPYLWVVAMVICGLTSWPTLLCILSLPVAIANAKMMMAYRKGGIEAFAALDEATAKLQLMFSTLLIIGLVISHFIN